MFPDTLMQVIVNETNRYAQQVMDDNSYAKWKRVDLAEMKAYFGFNTQDTQDSPPVRTSDTPPVCTRDTPPVCTRDTPPVRTRDTPPVCT